MRRSQVLSGKKQQRDRAQLRERLDRKSQPSFTDPEEQLEDWMKEHLSNLSMDAIERYDLAQFLGVTHSISLAPERRLGWLAVYLEYESSCMLQQPRCWLALERIYQEAIRLNPSQPWIHYARAIAAHICAEELPDHFEDSDAWMRSKTRHRMMKIAYQSMHLAMEHSPGNVDYIYSMGMLLYFDPSHSKEEALASYEQALVIDPTHGLSLQYKSHCLHDLERWKEAIQAYESIPAKSFVGKRFWIYDRILEQKAQCYLKSGATQKAYEQFSNLLSRWERDPSLSKEAIGWMIAQAAYQLDDDVFTKRLKAVFERDGRNDLLSRTP